MSKQESKGGAGEAVARWRDAQVGDFIVVAGATRQITALRKPAGLFDVVSKLATLVPGSGPNYGISICHGDRFCSACRFDERDCGCAS